MDRTSTSFITITRVCSVHIEEKLHVVAEWHPHTVFSCGCRSTRAEADRPDPAQTESHCSDNVYTRGGQTKCRQVNNKVGDIRRKKASCDM